MRITLRQLEIFLAVAQFGQVTGAAENLNISQPAASMALSELEKQVGPLFHRVQGFGLKMNDVGRSLRPKASELIDRAKELERQFAADGKYDSGSLMINASSTVGNNLLPKMLSQFREANPGIQIDLEIDNTRTIERRLLDFKIDLALAEGIHLHPNIEATPWLEDELVVVCDSGHPLAGGEGVPLSSLSGQWWVLREPDSGTRELFEEMIAPQLKETKVALVLNRAEAVKQAVCDGIGLACISELAVRADLNTGLMSSIGVKELNLKRNLYLLIHKKKYRSLVFNQLCRFIVDWKPD